jgi:hypothetical protein
VVRTLSTGQAFDTVIAGALSLIVQDERIGVWVPALRRIYWMTQEGQALQVETIAVEREQLPSGYFRLSGLSRTMEPHRMHDRAIRLEDVTYIEDRPVLESPKGGYVPAFVIAASQRRVDTVWVGSGTIYSVERGGVWVCCGRAPLFGTQVWWGIRRDGGLVVGSASKPEVMWLDPSGRPYLRVSWTSDGRPITKDDALANWRTAHERVLPDSPASYRRERIRYLKQRFEDFAGFVADSAPAFSQLIVDASDRVWVRRFDPRAWPDGLGSLWDVYDDVGDYCGTVRVSGINHVFRIGALGMLGSLRRPKGSHELVLASVEAC